MEPPLRPIRQQETQQCSPGGHGDLTPVSSRRTLATTATARRVVTPLRLKSAHAAKEPTHAKSKAARMAGETGAGTPPIRLRRPGEVLDDDGSSRRDGAAAIPPRGIEPRPPVADTPSGGPSQRSYMVVLAQPPDRMFRAMLAFGARALDTAERRLLLRRSLLGDHWARLNLLCLRFIRPVNADALIASWHAAGRTAQK